MKSFTAYHKVLRYIHSIQGVAGDFGDPSTLYKAILTQYKSGHTPDSKIVIKTNNSLHNLFASFVRLDLQLFLILLNFERRLLLNLQQQISFFAISKQTKTLNK